MPGPGIGSVTVPVARARERRRLEPGSAARGQCVDERSRTRRERTMSVRERVALGRRRPPGWVVTPVATLVLLVLAACQPIGGGGGGGSPSPGESPGGAGTD